MSSSRRTSSTKDSGCSVVSALQLRFCVSAFPTIEACSSATLNPLLCQKRCFPSSFAAMASQSPIPASEHQREDDLDSLPSTETSGSLVDEERESDAEKQWQESLQQLELLLTMVIVPYIGKYFGRKAAYWGTR
jgi:hypothetical protein